MYKSNPTMEAMLSAMNYADLNFGLAGIGMGPLVAAAGLGPAPSVQSIPRSSSSSAPPVTGVPDHMMAEFDGVALERKRFECPALPKGWIREEITRKTGLSAGKVDVCYYSPNGKKFLSKPQLSRYLGDSIDLSAFDFRTGKLNTLLIKPKIKEQQKIRTGSSQDLSRAVGITSPLMPATRQTASIFKQPVTVYKTQESRVKADFKHGHQQEKPKQLFWEKRLEKLRACNSLGIEQQKVDLPRGVKPIGPRIKAHTVLQSVAAAIHLNSQPIIGQTASRSVLESNPGVFVNPEQPLLYAVSVKEDDIKLQEEKVLQARKKLEESLRHFFD